MSDEELKHWQQDFLRLEEIPVALRRNYGQQQRRRRWILMFFGAVGVLGVGVAVAVIATQSDLHSRVLAGFLILATLVGGAIMGGALRGRRLAALASPEDLLADLVGRLATRERLVRIAPWLVTVVALGVGALTLTADTSHDIKMWGVAFCVAEAVAGWVMPVLLRPRLARQRALLERWRVET